MLNKADLRRTLIAKRSALDPDLRAQWDGAIAANLFTWWDANRISTLAVYWPMRGEPDLQAAYASLTAKGVQLALPVVVQKNAPLAFARWAPGDAVVKDTYGVFIPAVRGIVAPAALLIPCVGFNERRYRLGYGGGFYDRTLAQEPRPRAIGIAYSCLLTDFDTGSHDVALDAVITEQNSF